VSQSVVVDLPLLACVDAGICVSVSVELQCEVPRGEFRMLFLCSLLVGYLACQYQRYANNQQMQ
jgi:hypothetical protein